MIDFTGKTALVTGSGRGIGRTIAEQFAANGANVVVCDIDEATATQTAADLGERALGVRADVTSEAEIEALLKAAVDRFSRLDILVNNAGITRDGLLVRMSAADWDTVLDINLKGTFLVSKAAARIMMKQRSGRIVNIASVVGLGGNAGQTNYSASKAGMIGLTKSAARELAGRGITVNAVAPGYIATDMTGKLPEAAREEFLKRVFIGREGTPQDVASAVLFFASDQASYITGQVLAIDGGLSM
jgi:3-oxoacyl-[acyl-carrier protein] reductase